MSHPATVPVKAYFTDSAKIAFHAGEIKRRTLRDHDVSVKVLFCGICHSDLHTAKSEWGPAKYPCCPGHEIVGVVDGLGSKVTSFKMGEHVGVGCLVDACDNCPRCKEDQQFYCENGFTGTYNADDRVSGGHTHGGYSERIVVEDKWVLHIPDGLDLAGAAPLLCAGITTYTPLVEAKVGPGSKVGILGVGGLGHVAVKLAKALGAFVVAFTSKESKTAELKALGADDVIVSGNAEQQSKYKGQLDLIIDTVSADHDTLACLLTLKFNGRYHIVGAPPSGNRFAAFPMVFSHLSVTASLVGGVRLTQQMLDLCAKHKITAQIELAHPKDLDKLYDRLQAGDVRYRFVLDIANSFH